MDTNMLTFEVETITSYASGKRRAEDPLDGDPPIKKNKGGRPRGSAILPPPRKSATKLRVDRPVQARIPMDVWQTILGSCTLDFLIKVRTTCPSFYAALSSERAWKIARIRQFGEKIPDPPLGITEMQYADLLTGVGCQSYGCNGKARRTYWAFRRRWCEKCLGTKTVKGRDAKWQLPDRIISYRCLPQAKFDSWGHYQWVRDHDISAPWERLHGAQAIVFSKADINNLNKEHAEFAMSHGINEINEWLEERSKVNEVFIFQLKEVEKWAELHRHERLSDLAGTRDRRVTFFKQEASNMTPPMDEKLLELCPAYSRAIAISRPFSRRSWDSLRPKLEIERQDAQLKIEKRKRMEDIAKYRRHLIDDYSETVQSRLDGPTVEQRLVLSLADQVVDDLNTSEIYTADGDLVSVILRGIYKAYEDMDPSRKPVTQHGTYRLLMDDAKLVYEKKIVPLFAKWLDSPRYEQATALKCPVCGTAKDPLTFINVMEHLYDRHRWCEDFSYLRRVYANGARDSFPWLAIEWPRNLPMLAMHQVTHHRWDSDDDAPYVRADPPSNHSELSDPGPAPGPHPVPDPETLPTLGPSLVPSSNLPTIPFLIGYATGTEISPLQP